jgi:superfamily II helicase
MKTYEKQIEDYYSSWESFTKSSGEIDKEAFISLMTRAKRLAAAGSKIENPNPFESIVMSILVEHQRELSKLVDQLLTVKTKTCPRCNRTSSVEDFYKGNGIDDSISILCQRCQEALFFRKIENR